MNVKVIRYTEGGRGIEVLQLEIGDNCPKCDKPRGKLKDASMNLNGEIYNYDTWENDCGHLEDQRAIRTEAKVLLAIKMRDRLEVSVDCEDEKIKLIFNGIHDREGFLTLLEKLKSEENWQSSNYYDLEGCIKIDMECPATNSSGQPLDKAGTKVTGTAKIIKYKPVSYPHTIPPTPIQQ